MEIIEYKGFEIKIENDEYPSNPRTDWDNGSIMVCQHNRYSLGDEKHGVDLSDCNSWADVKQAIIDQKNPIVILPLYLYDHSGITMNTTGFSCNWDSGQVGFIFVDEAKATEIGWTKEYAETLAKGDDEKYKGKTREEILTNFMISDVEIYDNYLTGNVYRFEVYGCGGFYGDDHEESGLLDHARSAIDCEVNYKVKQRVEKLKEYIKAKVPVIYRKLPSIV
jgi:hypothetical protein